MLQHLFKPKWQSKKPAVRLKALVTLSGKSDELILLAKTDIDSEVRMYAVQKLQHIPTLASIAAKTDGVIPRAAKKRLSEVAISQNIDESALEHAYPLIDDYRVHDYVVRDGQKTLKVRKCALQYIDDQSLLFELAKTDQSKEIQYLAAAKIDDYAQLKQLEKLTKNNKRLRQLLKEKSQAHQARQTQLTLVNQLCRELEQLGNNNNWKQDKTHFLTIQQQWKHIKTAIPPELQQRYDAAFSAFEKKQTTYHAEEAKLEPLRNHYHTLIKASETLLKQLDQADHDLTVQQLTETLTDQQQQWETAPITETLKLDAQESEHIQQHYQRLQKQLSYHIKQLQQQQNYVNRFDHVIADIKKLLANKQAIQEKQLTHLQQRWQKIKLPQNMNHPNIDAPQKQYKQLIQQLKQRLDQQQQHIKKHIIQIEQWLDTMEDCIKAEQLSQAIQLHQKATQHLNQYTFPAIPYRRMKQRIQAATPTIKSAQGWRHWGTDQAREQLINQAQLLSEAEDIPPLERAKQLKVLRQKWKQLGKIDPQHQQTQWQTFDTWCTKAYEPCQQFYQQESNSRNQNLQKRQDICEALQQLEQETQWHSVNWKQINKTIYQYRSQWKQTGAVDRSHWQKINQQFNEAMEDLEQHLAEERRINWTKRQNLVRQAETLLNELQDSQNLSEDLPTFIATAKQLQTQWQPTVTRSRSEEQALWNQFRLAIDAIFNQQRDLHHASQHQLSQNLDNKQVLLQQLEDLYNTMSEADTTVEIHNQFKQLEQQFNTITSLPKGKAHTLQNRFNMLKTQFTQSLVQQQQQQQLKQLILLAEKTTLCRIVDKTDNIHSQWEILDKLQDKKIEQKITSCFQQIANQNNAQPLEDLFNLVLDIEILLGLPSPSDYQAARMKRQVERLSEQMLKASETEANKQRLAVKQISTYYLHLANDIENQKSTEVRFSQIEAWIKTSLESVKKC